MLQGEANGIIAIQSVVVTDNPTVNGQPATATVQLVFAAPLPDDRYTLSIDASSLMDPAGNKLDGESNASQPNRRRHSPRATAFPAAISWPASPSIAGRKSAPGAAATPDRHQRQRHLGPEQRRRLEPRHGYAIGYTSDKDFAGNFAVPTSLNGPAATAAANGFSKLSAYGFINSAVNIASATESGNVVTITTTTPQFAAVGNVAVITGVSVAGYNGTYKITSVPSSTTFT